MNEKVCIGVGVRGTLAGCAPATMQGLREKPHGQTKFEVQRSYQSVYRTVLNNSRKCWQAGLITAQMIVTGDLYSDTRSGEVTVALHGGAGVDTYFGVDIKAVAEDRTEVQTFSAGRGWAPAASAVKEWLELGHTDCAPRSS